MSGTLFIVATPIGNLGDMTPRALDVLREVDFVAAEDSRVALKLLSCFDISKPVVSYHEHNKYDVGPKILKRIEIGENCALTTDAGMPAVSDPGCELVCACHAASIPVTVLPGASAVVCAVALSGFAARRFCFEGFLPTDGSGRAAALARSAAFEGCLVFYEAPHRLRKTLVELADVLGDMPTAVIKEISKIHETVNVTSLAAAAKNPDYEQPKGEFVIVIDNSPPPAPPALQEALEFARELIALGVTPSDAAKYAAKKLGAKKNEVYAALCAQ